MKIIFIVEKFPILSQTFIINQITGLIDRGHEVFIYAEFNEDEQKTHPEVEQYNLLKRAIFHPRFPQNRLVCIFKGLKLLATNFLSAPFLTLRCLNFVKYGRDAVTLRLLYAVTPFVRQQPTYDAIQCHFGLLGIRGMILRDVGAIKGNLITAFHGVDMSQNLQIFGEHLYDRLFEAGDYFLPISQHWQNKLIQLGCHPDRIATHHMGIDCQRFIFAPRTPTLGVVRFISVARLTEKKGIEFAIRAVAKILDQHPKIEYNIVGDGELLESLTHLIHNLGAGNQIKLLGWKDQTEVVELMNHSHILLAPSVTAKDGNQEGIPVVLMEAMASGIPVVSTYHSGIPELVQNGVSGFLIPERDVEALSAILIGLIQHPEQWAEIARAARLTVEQQYDINCLNEQLDSLYQRLLSGQTPPLLEERNDVYCSGTNLSQAE
ncbi:MAG: glycosyltransferase [Drouetiella hepatica Uher 2000/2452]|jgi:colanic acid/amylovoran biosynthesis glycosyltransferase|uniref:Glycosyltransferase n=1 Tax=Drouetiella hepatica Uher 2000/2452 TaxID=904376 RepID=A0A951QBL8_9CYAN|nr:glycosyltransferase [Drouetiella hepatica Uher 2000/2452]